MTIELKVPTATQTVINLSSKKQEQIQKVSIQIATGYEHQDFQGLASDGSVEKFISLNSTLSATETFKKSNQIIVARTQTSEQALDQIIDIAQEITKTIAQRNNGASGNNVPISVLAPAYLDSIAAALNTRFDGRYLFAGTKTDTKPIENIQSSNIASDGAATTSYYRGNSDIASIKISQSQELAYGVNANDEAFQKLIGSVHLLIDGDATDDAEKLGSALNMVNEAIEQIVSIVASTRSSTNTILQSNIVLSDVSKLAKRNLSDVSSVNLAEATTKMAELETIIQATYLAFNRLSGLRLSNFLN